MNVLVIGDWIFDENWVAGVHRSPLSSRTGKMHYRGLNPYDGATHAFCGAGLTSQVLLNAKIGKSNFVDNVIGVGIWHKNDEELLNKMFDVNYVNKLRADMLSRDIDGVKADTARVHLINLACSAEKVKSKKTNKEQQSEVFGTTKVIRIYQQTEQGDVNLVQRLDWEHLPNHDMWEKLKSNLRSRDKTKNVFIKSLIECVRNLEGNRKAKLDAVIIKDHKKGVVQKELLQALNYMIKHSTYGNLFEKDIPMFVASKVWSPDWLHVLRERNVKLILFPPSAANEAIKRVEGDGKPEGLTCWFTGRDMPSKEALEAVKQPLKYWKNINKQPIVMIQPEKFKLIVYSPYDERVKGEKPKRKPRLILQSKQWVRPGPLYEDLPFYSIFLGAVTSLLMRHKADKREVEVRRILTKAMIFTQRAQRYAHHRLTSFIQANGNDMSDKDILDATHIKCHDLQKYVDNSFEDHNWKDYVKEWENATDKAKEYYGFDLRYTKKANQSKENRIIKLSKAMTEVNNYICLRPDKRMAIRKIVLALSAFKNGDSAKSESCLLEARPGSGKSYLAKCLADAVGFVYLKFNITQMLNKDSLFDCFDKIVTTQAQNRDKPLLVFFDEVNAELEGQPVYPSFLAPLEEGKYIRGDKAFHIHPCVWIFAQTRRKNDKKEPAKSKVSDFVSRLSLPKVDLSRDGGNGARNDKWLKLERVYAGAALIGVHYCDVNAVSYAVLKLFYDLGDKISFRQLGLFIRQFSHVQYGRVHLGNVPLEWLSEQNIKLGNIQWFSNRQKEESEHPSKKEYYIAIER